MNRFFAKALSVSHMQVIANTWRSLVLLRLMRPLFRGDSKRSMRKLNPKFKLEDELLFIKSCFFICCGHKFTCYRPIVDRTVITMRWRVAPINIGIWIKITGWWVGRPAKWSLPMHSTVRANLDSCAKWRTRTGNSVQSREVIWALAVVEDY